MGAKPWMVEVEHAGGVETQTVRPMQPGDVPGLARAYLDRAGLAHWRFRWDRAKRRAGQCRHDDRTITMSVHYAALNCAERPDVVRDTILHEVAHALAGAGHGHDEHWRACCLRVGARPVRCYGDDVAMPRGKLEATCAGCGRRFTRHKAVKRGSYGYCVACGPVAGRLTYSIVTEITRDVTRRDAMPDEATPDAEEA